MKILNRIILASAAALAMTTAQAENVIMHLPSGFQVLAVSPNGQWACGVFVDAGLNMYPFRWNLLSGSYLMLGNGEGTAWDVADDGTVSGDFQDKEASGNGAPIPMAGYWRDGQWHHMQMPDGTVVDGFGGGITADGHYMTGTILVDGRYRPYIWKDGQIHRSLDTGKDAVSYAVSPDGNSAAGFSTQKNRTACYWAPDGTLVYFMDSPSYSQGPWNYSRNFSPDGTKLLYWGGWEIDEDQSQHLYSVYDITTGQKTRVDVPGEYSDLEFFDISNRGTLVGLDQGRGYIWLDGKGMYVDEYLQMRGVDLSTYEDFYSTGDYYAGQLPISRIVSISEDENVVAMNYYNKIGEMTSMVIKFDQDLSHVSPAEVSARQLPGLSTVALNWKRPVGVTAVRGYNVYRDGKKISGMMPITTPAYYDRNLQAGTYTYEVAAVTTAGTETCAEAVTIEVAAPGAQAPQALFCRQHGINDALLTWQTPASNMAHLRYYDPAQVDFTGFSVYTSVDMEMAVRYDKAELANYAGQRISEVSFYPSDQHPAWAINFYTYDADGALVKVASRPVNQRLESRQRNTVHFDEPVDLPDGDLIVAIEVNVSDNGGNVMATHIGHCVPGYSDLMRRVEEDDFFSAYDASLEDAMMLTSITWTIDLGLEGDDAPAALDHYNLYVDDAKVMETTEPRGILTALTDGLHMVGVEAEYADGQRSTIENAAIEIASAYPSVDNLTVDIDGLKPRVEATWEAPVDNDATFLGYTTAQRSATGIMGTETNNYALTAAVRYPMAMTKGYEGYRVDAFRFYPLTDALYTFLFYADDMEVYEYEVEDYKLNCWNEVKLSDDIILDANTEYRLVLDCFDPTPGQRILGLDDQAPYGNFADLYSVDGGINWSTLTVDAGTHGNWMLGFTVVDPEGTDAAVDGYDLVIDGVVRNASRLSEAKGSYEFAAADDKDHTIRVDTYYPGVTEAVEGVTSTFRLDASGIADVATPDVSIAVADGYIQAVGDGVVSMALIGADGRQLAAAEGCLLSTSGVPAGVHVLEIRTLVGPVIQKVKIK